MNRRSLLKLFCVTPLVKLIPVKSRENVIIPLPKHADTPSYELTNWRISEDRVIAALKFRKNGKTALQIAMEQYQERYGSFQVVDSDPSPATPNPNG